MANPHYIVLARKYRPENFSQLIGQEAMVRTLRNAFASDKIAQVFMLTGIRGTGKTTTARLIARAVNFEPVNGDSHEAHETFNLNAYGRHCQAILEGRHVDVIEMDAASHTGIEDIREIISSVQYRPASAKYKVYIIDEVHMLSNQAFNGLLKTLEEPPPHAKFILATTEIRKVPVTILSRCQRFELRRVTIDDMTTHLMAIADKEQVIYDKQALVTIARAAEGSVRDALSVLDQAIAYSGDRITNDNIANMLGLAGTDVKLKLFEMLMAGNLSQALTIFRAAYSDGADPLAIMCELADFTHLVTRIKHIGLGDDAKVYSENETKTATDMAEKLDGKILIGAWQVLLKAIDEVKQAYIPVATAEMALVKFAYIKDLAQASATQKTNSETDNGRRLSDNPRQTETPTKVSAIHGLDDSAKPLQPAPIDNEHLTTQAGNSTAPVSIKSFDDLIDCAGEKRVLPLKVALETYVQPLEFTQGAITIAIDDGAPTNLVNKINEALQKWTGSKWKITVEDNNKAVKKNKNGYPRQLQENQLFQAAITSFPDAHITNIKKTK